MKKYKPTKFKKILVVIGLFLLLALSLGTYYYLNSQKISTEDASASKINTVELNGLTLSIYPKNNLLSTFAKRLSIKQDEPKTTWIYKVTGKVSSCYSAVTVDSKQDNQNKEKYNIVVNLQGSNCANGTRSLREVNHTGNILGKAGKFTYHFELNYTDNKNIKSNIKQVEGYTLTSSLDYISNKVLRDSDISKNKKVDLNGWKYRIQGVTSGCFVSTESVDSSNGIHTLLLTYNQKSKNGVECKNLKNKIDISNAIVSNYKGERSLKVKYIREGVIDLNSQENQQSSQSINSHGYTLLYNYIGKNTWSYNITSPSNTICISRLKVDTKVMESYPEQVSIVGVVVKFSDTPNTADCNETKPESVKGMISASEKAKFSFQIKE